MISPAYMPTAPTPGYWNRGSYAPMGSPLPTSTLAPWPPPSNNAPTWTTPWPGQFSSPISPLTQQTPPWGAYTLPQARPAMVTWPTPTPTQWIAVPAENPPSLPTTSLAPTPSPATTTTPKASTNTSPPAAAASTPKMTAAEIEALFNQSNPNYKEGTPGYERIRLVDGWVLMPHDMPGKPTVLIGDDGKAYQRADEEIAKFEEITLDRALTVAPPPPPKEKPAPATQSAPGAKTAV